MTFQDTVNSVVAGLSLTTPDIALIVVGLATVILYAKSFRIGLISHLLSFGMCYIAFYLLGWETFKPLILTMLFVVALTLSLFMSYSKTAVN
jgi:hypothetical protein